MQCREIGEHTSAFWNQSIMVVVIFRVGVRHTYDQVNMDQFDKGNWPPMFFSYLNRQNHTDEVLLSDFLHTAKMLDAPRTEARRNPQHGRVLSIH